MIPPILDMAGLVKDYGGLRPLRVRALTVGPGEIVALAGLDRVAAEVLTNLITGAVLPDAGDLRVFGSPTRDVEDQSSWLALVDRIGLVSDRVVLLEAFTVAQNLAIPLTLDLEPVPEPFARAAAALGREVGLTDQEMVPPLEATQPVVRLKVRLARALALDPSLLILEHPTTDLPPGAAGPIAATLRRLARARRVAVLAMSGDVSFSRRLADRCLALRPASGDLVAVSGWRRLFG